MFSLILWDKTYTCANFFTLFACLIGAPAIYELMKILQTGHLFKLFIFSTHSQAANS